jgi:hypothetical protein
MTLGAKAQQPGFPTELGNRCRDSHIATATTAATLFQNSKPERIILVAFPNPSGSFFDWKRLVSAIRCHSQHCHAIQPGVIGQSYSLPQHLRPGSSVSPEYLLW